MESAIARISFTEKEQKYYAVEFDRLTSEQKKPLNERELMGHGAATFFRMLKIGDSDLAKIWELVSESQPFLKFPNFMAAMRLCSARKQGKPIIADNFMKEQSVLARRQREKPNPTPAPTNKSTNSSQNENSQDSSIKAKEESPQLNKEEGKSQEEKKLPEPLPIPIQPLPLAIEDNKINQEIKQEQKSPLISEELKNQAQIEPLKDEQQVQPPINANSDMQDNSKELSPVVKASENQLINEELKEKKEEVKEDPQAMISSSKVIEEQKEIVDSIIPNQVENFVSPISENKEIIKEEVKEAPQAMISSEEKIEENKEVINSIIPNQAEDFVPPIRENKEIIKEEVKEAPQAMISSQEKIEENKEVVNSIIPSQVENIVNPINEDKEIKKEEVKDVPQAMISSQEKIDEVINSIIPSQIEYFVPPISDKKEIQKEEVKEAPQLMVSSQEKIEENKEAVNSIIPSQFENFVRPISEREEVKKESKNIEEIDVIKNRQPDVKDLLDLNPINAFPVPIISENKNFEENKLSEIKENSKEEIRDNKEQQDIVLQQKVIENIDSIENIGDKIVLNEKVDPIQNNSKLLEEEKIDNSLKAKEINDKINEEVKQINISQEKIEPKPALKESKESVSINSDPIPKIDIPIVEIDSEKNIKQVEIQPFEDINLDDLNEEKLKKSIEKFGDINNTSEEKINLSQKQIKNSFKESVKNPSDESTPSQAIRISNSDLFNEEVFPRVQIASINLNEDEKSEERNSEESSEVFQSRLSKPISTGSENLLNYLEAQGQAFSTSNDIISSPSKAKEASFQQEEFNNEIIVEAPIHVSSGWFGSSSYYLYPIMTRFNGNIYNVKRRFSDLDWMHNLLIVKYKGFIIPPRPDKKYINNNDDKFIEERRIQMEKYLNIILRHPILCNSSPFRVFTQSSNEKFETDKAQAEASQDTLEYRNFEDMYDKVMAKVQNKFQVLFAQKILPFSKEISIIEDKIEKMDVPVQALSETFSIWTQRQKETSKSLAGVSMPENPELSRIMQRFSLVHQENLSELHTLSLEIHEEQLRLEGLKLAVSSYKSMIDEYSQQETLISRKLAKHRASADDDTASRYLSEIQFAQDTLDKLNETLSGIEKNIIQENTSFDEDRGKHILKTIVSICSQQNNYYEEEKKFWREIANAPKGRI